MRIHLITVIAILAASVAPAQSVPTSLAHDQLLTGLSSPYDFSFLPDGRVLIAQGGGLIRVWTGIGAAASVGAVPNTQFGGEHGLLCVEPDPDFATNGYIYVWASRTNTPNMVLSRFTLTGDLSNPNSTNLNLTDEHILLDNAPDNAFNHNGGACRFGPDGMLYLTIGDDANACSAQVITSMTGVLLRIDVSGVPAGPSATPPPLATLDPGDNPYSGATNHSALVIARGLRNPWRMEIDQLTGNVYIGDVGAGSREEFDEYVYPTTGPLTEVNFGWPWREGLIGGFGCGGTQPPNLVDPIVDVSHAQGWVACMTGPRYRTQGGPFDFPASYEGDYFYSDYFAGNIRRLDNTAGTWAPGAAVAGQPTPTEWGTGFGSITALRQGPDGALYYTRATGQYGRIRGLGPLDGVAVISGADQFAPAGEPIAQPLVVEVTDPGGAIMPGAQVDFFISGAGTLSTTNPVFADATGRAQTMVTTLDGPGQATITVTAKTPGGDPSGTNIQVYRRDLNLNYITTTPSNDLIVFAVSNHSLSSPPDVTYTMFLGPPGQPPLSTFIGPLCLNPFDPATVAFEDPFGFFGGAGSPGGSTGSPNLTKIYFLPNGALTGFTFSFLAIGYDDTSGFHRTDCVTMTF